MSAPVNISGFTPQNGETFGATTVIDATSPDTLTLPSGKFATDATFLKQGDDLQLTGPDGETVIVRDYFLGDPAPDLMTPEGGRLSPELVNSFTPPEAAGQFAQMGAGGAQPIGQAQSTAGTVFVARASGVREELQAGDPIYQGDVVETADGGAVDLLFVDKTTFALGGDARLAIDELVYDPNTHEGSSSFSILKGMFVFSSGEIAKVNPLDMTVKTTVATIGIRGTKVAGEVKPAGEESKFTILEGEIVVVTDEGYTVLSDANETSTVTGFDAPPSEAVLFSDAEISGFYGEVKSISNGFYNSGAAGKRDADDKNETENEQGATQENETAPKAEADGNEPDLDKLAEALSDLAPAAGGDTEQVNEREEISDTDIESREVDLGGGFGNDAGFEASKVATPASAPAPKSAGKGNDDGTNDTPIAETPATPVDGTPVVANLTAQSAQAQPTVIGHTLTTQSSINGVTMSDLELANEHAVTLTFMSEGAGYRNTVGYYKIDDDGQLTDASLIWENASANRSGGNLNPGESSFALDVAAGDKIGFFIIANGDRRNDYDKWGEGVYEFRDGDGDATVDSVNPSLFFIGEDGVEHQVKGYVYHTAEADGAIQLNADGRSHTISNIDPETGGLVIGFEDLKNLGDRDFNDLVIRIDFEPVVGEALTPITIAPDISLADANDATLSEATLEIASGYEDGDILQVAGLEEFGIAITEQGFDETAGVYRLVLSGEASLEDYEAALSSVELASLSNDVAPGVREIEISVTDANGVESDVATTSVAIEAANTIDGTADADVLSGTTGNDIINGGDDDDVIIGNGGEDALRGEDGDDRLVLGDDGFILADGGAGTDTAVIDFDLDLTAVDDNAISGIESFDLRDGEASLTIGLDDILAATSGVNALTETENTLIVRRDADDTVTVVGEDWDISTEELDTDGDDETESYTVYSDAATGAAIYVEAAAGLA
ncbi:MAG: DUF4114 domain-containing protein [Alphaproteobacteria bacterium]|nr:DUF4114 domain-containing protein [Alphaproteobacteria bacterium]